MKAEHPMTYPHSDTSIMPQRAIEVRGRAGGAVLLLSASACTYCVRPGAPIVCVWVRVLCAPQGAAAGLDRRVTGALPPSAGRCAACRQPAPSLQPSPVQGSSAGCALLPSQSRRSWIIGAHVALPLLGAVHARSALPLTNQPASLLPTLKPTDPPTAPPPPTRPQVLYEESKGEAIVCTGVGQHQMWAAQFYPKAQPRQWVSSGGLGSMGFGLPSGERGAAQRGAARHVQRNAAQWQRAGRQGPIV